MALKPDEMDFISNFSTLWQVFLGAILATLGGFGATQAEWFIERRRRERDAAVFFGELLSTLKLLLNIADSSKQRGDPYGQITLRFLRSAVKEADIYTRNRESLFDLRDSKLRARIHTLVLRIVMPADGVFDTSDEIAKVRAKLKEPGISKDEREELEGRLVNLHEAREGSYEALMDAAAQLKGLVRELEPIAGNTYEHLDSVPPVASSEA